MRLGNGPRGHSRDARAQGECRHRHRCRELLGQSQHVRVDEARLDGLEGPGPRDRSLADHRRGSDGGDPRAARERSASATSSARIAPGYKADHRPARPALRELDAGQQPGQPAGPYRGRQRRALGHGRRQDGGREPPRSSAPTWRRWPARSRRRAPGSPRSTRPNRALYDRLEPVVNGFCPGLARMPYHIDRFGGGTHTHSAASYVARWTRACILLFE